MVVEFPDVSFLVARKVLKVAQCFAKLMEEANAASSKTATKVLREAHHFVKGMEVENDVPLMVVESAPKVSMEALSTVLPMEVGNAVLLKAVGKVPVAGQISVCDMVVVNVVKLRVVAKVHKVVQTSVKLMEGENGANGESRVPILWTLLETRMVTEFQELLVINLREVRLAFVLPTVHLFQIDGSMEVALWEAQ